MNARVLVSGFGMFACSIRLADTMNRVMSRQDHYPSDGSGGGGGGGGGAELFHVISSVTKVLQRCNLKP